MQNPFLIGPRLYLRPLEKADAPLCARFMNDPDVRRTLKRNWPLSVAEEENWVANVANARENVVLGICLRDGDRLIGTVGLSQFDWVARHASFGISVGEKDCWDKGYGSEAMRLIIGHAFETLNLQRVWLDVNEFNPRAFHVYEKLGFVTEGRLRRQTFRDGRFWDVIRMGLLREEWKTLSESP
jgi:RimJ/RimL family protein N-acetyltransferase